MSSKEPFTFLVRPSERVILKQLADIHERSEAAMLRWLIRQASRQLGFPAPIAERNHSPDGEGVLATAQEAEHET